MTTAMTTAQYDKLMRTPVRTFFCPELAEGRLSFNDALNKRVIDLCASFSITTVADLTMRTPEQLQGASFPQEEIRRIEETLGTHGLKLRNKFAAFGTRGICPTISVTEVRGGRGYASPWIMNP
jgi:hypothetical protein